MSVFQPTRLAALWAVGNHSAVPGDQLLLLPWSRAPAGQSIKLTHMSIGVGGNHPEAPLATEQRATIHNTQEAT